MVFVFFLGLWTYELLAENPVPESVSRAIPDEWKFWLAKGLHVAGYAFLTVLAWWLPVPRLVFGLVIAGLVLHGAATEFGQTFVSGRHGSLRDVLLDWLGVIAGLTVVGAWYCATHQYKWLAICSHRPANDVAFSPCTRQRSVV